MKEYTQQYINGEWRTGTGSSMLENRNPYTGEILYIYRSASKQDVDDAYQAASEAQKLWKKTSPAEKQTYLERLVQVISEEKENIYYWTCAEGGSVKPKSDFEFFTSIAIVKEVMSFPERMKGTILPSNIPGKENYIYREPKGVIGSLPHGMFRWYWQCAPSSLPLPVETPLY